VLYPCVTAVAVLATGNHFLLDLVGGLVAIGVSVAIVWMISELTKRSRQKGAGSPSRMATSARPTPRGACHKLVTKSKVR
jgi:hypothetical protein